MKRSLATVGICLLCLAGFALAKEKKHKPGPLTGTWECVSHGGPQGDMPFTLILHQEKENVTGSVSSPIGGTDITSGAFKSKRLEIQLDTPQGNYLLTARLKKGQLAGEWSHDNNKGPWEGKKKAQAGQ